MHSKKSYEILARIQKNLNHVIEMYVHIEAFSHFLHV